MNLPAALIWRLKWLHCWLHNLLKPVGLGKGNASEGSVQSIQADCGCEFMRHSWRFELQGRLQGTRFNGL